MLRNAHGGVPYVGAKDVLQQAQLAWREPWLLAFLQRRRRRPVHDLRLPQAQLTRSAAVLWTHPAWRVGRRGRRGALALVMEETGSRLWRAERQRCGRHRQHGRRCHLRLGRWLRLLPPANARGDRLFDRGCAPWRGALRRGVEGVSRLQGLDAFDDGSHSRYRCSRHLLGMAGQRCFELVAQGRQLLQIASMSKTCTQARFIIPLLALGDADIPGCLVAFSLIAADKTFEGVEDRAWTVKFPRQW